MTGHPRDVLFGARAGAVSLPVCDHYSGVESRMRKSLVLQREMTEAFGACVFDITLDCEDGAPVGGEADHAALVAEIALDAAPGARVAVRVHSVDHDFFEQDVRTILGRAGHRLCHVMLPKVESVADIECAARAIDAASFAQGSGESGHGATTPLHALIESPGAVHRAFEIAAHPRVASLSFGLMDFVSAHGGAIPGEAMTAAGQFAHPLVMRAKAEVASACHAVGKTPSHNVVTEFADAAALRTAARRAARELGYTRMWSIHPDQIRPIVEAFAPDEAEIEIATKIIAIGARNTWAPVRFDSKLEDRASYRYHWQVLERAHRTGRPLPDDARGWFAPATAIH